jgi:hypothetical protein
MSRNVRKLNTLLRKKEPDAPLSFSEFSHTPHLILLGEAGSGKTHLFREQATEEKAAYVTARAFLNLPAKKLSGQALFIDGLDERRAGRGDRDTVDAIVRHLFEVEPSRVRISCRVADWLGETDLAALNTYFSQSSEPVVLLLETLSQDEQVEVIRAQGAQLTPALEFLGEVHRRGLDDFLKNPQNLVMLWDVAKDGIWPANRGELFELATKLMLQEPNSDRARLGAGSYSSNEVRPAASAIFAASLISDVEAVSLTEQEGTADVPGYRSIPFASHPILQAAMSRRVFIAGSEPESVKYAHRTTAEYLGAKFLADRVRAGLPLGRVTALLGVDGHPAPELRGLHAWLAVHLHDRAQELIETDPYGVLTYGDAASLTRSACRTLIKALGRLSQIEPWFHSGSDRSPALGALARPDMISELRALLGDKASGFGARSIAIDAFWLGCPAPEAVPDLAAAFADDSLPYVPRLHALFALERLGDVGRRAAKLAFTGLGQSMNGMRLRADSILLLCSDCLGLADVLALVADALAAPKLDATGIFWAFADQLPLHDLPAILDGVQVPQHQSGYHKGRWEVGAFYSRILRRQWIDGGELEPARFIPWLYKNWMLNQDRGDRIQELRASMLARPERLNALAHHFLSTLKPDDKPWRAFTSFQEATLYTTPLLKVVIDDLEGNAPASQRQLFLYEMAFRLVYQGPISDTLDVFEKLCEWGGSREGFQEASARQTVWLLPEGYLNYKANRAPEYEANLKQQLIDFDKDEALIRNARHLGWIQHIAHIYFAEYADVDKSASPRERLIAWGGESRVEACLEGLRATLFREPLPTLKEALELICEDKHYNWWHGLVAGLNERWATQSDFSGLSVDFVQALVAFNLTNPVWSTEKGSERIVTPPWLVALLDERPDLVAEVYLAIAQEQLSRNKETPQGLHELMTDEHFAAKRSGIAVRLLRDFPSLPLYQLGQMLDIVLSDVGSHGELLSLAQKVISGTTAVGSEQFEQWMAAGYFLSPSEYTLLVETHLRNALGLVFALRDRGTYALKSSTGAQGLPLEILRFLVKAVGEHYPEVPVPLGGTYGDKNPWDISQYVLNLINAISARPTKAATDALVVLRDDPALSSYKPQLLYVIGNQARLRRDAEYERPDWTHTLAALSNGPPATVTDLFALAVDQIRDYRNRIQRENTDLYRNFWNTKGKALDTPRIEEYCRDFFITLLKSDLLAMNVTVEPEPDTVADKRGDISIAMPKRKILCELKRSHHAEVWTAATNQLDRFYAHDPESKGLGIYVVFWFGEGDSWNIPPPPNGQQRPTSAAGMEQMLVAALPELMRARITVVVIDVTDPYKKTT